MNTKTTRRRQAGFSLIELLIVVIVILIIAAVAVGALIKARLRANETSAAASLRAINVACTTYASVYGTGFPASLNNLAPAAIASASTADLIEGALVTGIKSGYTFTYTAGAPSGSIISTYSLTAEPVNRGSSGQRGFYTNQVFVIHVNATGPAVSTDPPI